MTNTTNPATDPAYLAAIEAARARPSVETMMRLREVLGQHYETAPAASSQLWREALALLDDPAFGTHG